MRTSAMAAILVIFIAGVVIFTGQGLTRGTQANAASATPESARVGIATVKDSNGNDTNQFEFLVRITLQPGVGVPNTTHHFGPSVLYVQTGAICYHLNSMGAGEVNVQAPSAAASVTPSAAASTTPSATETETAGGCPAPAPSCADSCPLADGDSVLLKAGDSVSQSIAPSDSVDRGYKNVGTEEAIVLLANLSLTDGPAVSCSGDCY
jgi:hypothetical protein